MRIKQATILAQENFPEGNNAGVNLPGTSLKEQYYRWIFSGVRQFSGGHCSIKQKLPAP